MGRARPGDVVVVTGASSGLGLDASLTLAARGYRVAAGYRDPRDRARLSDIDGVTPLVMDVTDEAGLREAAADARLLGARVAGLVVNAGVAVGAPVELTPPAALRRALDVNVVGAVSSIRAFLPDVRAGRGRVLLMSSVSGRRSAPVVGPYAATKYALEALGDALRMEVRRQGVDVVILEPGSVRTPIWGKSRRAGDEAVADADPAVISLYDDMLAAGRRVTERARVSGLDPAVVSEAILRVLESPRPPTRVPLGRRVPLQTRILARILPDRVFDRIRLRAMGIRR
ncbi:MAG: SDR family NAD(P)-dependent oxidoreductase [Acidimicrobiia bacterium]|nr:SDR family NAD(P)-dependent oxidoreductase [Acidimicrobiia bacterium]